MTAAFTIRRARPGDEDSILALLWEFAIFERLTHIFKLKREIIARDFMGEAARVNCDVAECDGSIAGVMTWYRTYGTFEATPYLYLDDIYVRAEFRRRGIAKTFLRHLARRARDEGAARIDWIVLDWNAPAIAFYRGIGAKLADEWRICRLSGEALERIAQ